MKKQFVSCVSLQAFRKEVRNMEYTAGKTKTAQLIESEDVANIKIRLKYASKEIELPDDYTVIIVPKYQ